MPDMFKLIGQQNSVMVFRQTLYRLGLVMLLGGLFPVLGGARAAEAATTSEASASAISSLNAGTAAIQSGRALEALDYLNSAIESNALSVEGVSLAYHHRAIAHQKLGLSGHAVADYTSAIWQGGLPVIVVPRSYYNRAVAYAQMGQQARAARDYDKAIELAPDYAAAYHNRGNLRRHMTQHAASIADYSRALELGMGSQAHLTHFARALSYNALGNRSASLEDAAYAAELKPDFTVAHDALVEWSGEGTGNSSVAQVEEPTVRTPVVAERPGVAEPPIITASIASESTASEKPAQPVQSIVTIETVKPIVTVTPDRAVRAGARAVLPHLDAVRVPTSAGAYRPVTLRPPSVAAIEGQSGNVTITPLSQALPPARATNGWEATVTRFVRAPVARRVTPERVAAVPADTRLATASIAPDRGGAALRASSPVNLSIPARSQPVRVAKGSETTVTDTSTGAAQPGLRVQVGSFRSAAEATTAWDEISGAHPALIGPRQPFVTEVNLGSRGTFYRLQLGPFGSKNEVRTFCRALKLRGQDCIAALR